MFYAGLLGLMLASVFLAYTGRRSPAPLHLGGLVRRVEPLRLHHEARPLADRLVPHHGLFGVILAMIVNVFLKSQGLEFIISILGVLIFAGSPPGHAADQGELQ